MSGEQKKIWSRFLTTSDQNLHFNSSYRRQQYNTKHFLGYTNIKLKEKIAIYLNTISTKVSHCCRSNWTESVSTISDWEVFLHELPYQLPQNCKCKTENLTVQNIKGLLPCTAHHHHWGSKDSLSLLKL